MALSCCTSDWNRARTNCIAAFGAKDRAGSGFLPCGKFEQLAAEFGGQQNGADLAFERDRGLAVYSMVLDLYR